MHLFSVFIDVWPYRFVIFSKDISAPVSIKNVNLASEILSFKYTKLLELLLAVNNRFMVDSGPGQSSHWLDFLVPQLGCSVGGSGRFPID